MTEEYKPIDLGGYEGHFKCPNCGNHIGIQQGNTGGSFICHESSLENVGGCGKQWHLFAKEVTDD